MERSMYLKTDDGIYDGDLAFLKDLVALLDSRLDEVWQAIVSCSDPDGMGHCDNGEYVVGMGFIACQRYLASTYSPHGMSKNIALRAGPRHIGGETIARIVNAGANFWKHSDEWDSHSTVFRNPAGLNQIQLETIQVIETVTPWADYTCANLLAALAAPAEPRLKYLLPQLEAWRDALDSAHVG
jgi:hypothetical protein